MKNQNDLIISIVCGVLAIGAAITFYFTKREPVAPAPPEAVPTARAQLQPGAVTFADSLPGGGSGPGGGGGGGAAGFGGAGPATSRGGGGGGAGSGLPSFVAGSQGQGR